MMSRPKVLMFIDWYLPGYRAGGPIRSCANMVAQLSDEVDFYIVTSDRDYQSEVSYDSVALNCWTRGRHGEYVIYLPTQRMTKSFICSLLEERIYNQVYIHGVFSSKFSIAPLRALHNSGLPITVAPRGMLRKSAIQLKRAKKNIYLCFAKSLGLFKHVQFHATDTQEAEDIRKWIEQNSQISIAPNLPKSIPEGFKTIEKNPGSLRLIFAGRVAPEKNLKYALQVLSKCIDVSVDLDIYGAIYNQVYTKECRSVVDSMPDGIKISFHEPVLPERVPSLLAEYHALFLPTRGENFGHVILETFMAGRPVLISDQTPWTGLSEEGVGHDLKLQDQDAFIREIHRWVAMDNSAYQQLSSNSFAKAKSFAQDPEILSASKALFLPRE